MSSMMQPTMCCLKTDALLNTIDMISHVINMYEVGIASQANIGTPHVLIKAYDPAVESLVASLPAFEEDLGYWHKILFKRKTPYA